MPYIRYLVVSVLILLGLSSASCDLSGSGDAPDWVGNWRETSQVDGPSPGNDDSGPYYSATKSKFEKITRVAFGCVVEAYDVEEVNGDTLEVIPRDEQENDREEIRLEKSGNTLTIEFLDADDGETSTVTAEPLDEDPRAAADCESSS